MLLSINILKQSIRYNIDYRLLVEWLRSIKFGTLYSGNLTSSPRLSPGQW